MLKINPNILVIILIVITKQTSAATPGSTKTTWKPEQVLELSAYEKEKLNAAKCLIESYRSEEDDTPERQSTNPDAYDKLMVLRGAFADPTQKDLVVVCLSSGNKERFIYIVWGASKQCLSRIQFSSMSRYFKTYGFQEDRYGANFMKTPPSKILEATEGVFDEYKTNETVMDIATWKYWMLDKEKLPKFTHDSLSYFNVYGSQFYCNDGQWIQLLDLYTDYTD